MTVGWSGRSGLALQQRTVEREHRIAGPVFARRSKPQDQVYEPTAMMVVVGGLERALRRPEPGMICHGAPSHRIVDRRGERGGAASDERQLAVDGASSPTKKATAKAAFRERETSWMFLGTSQRRVGGARAAGPCLNCDSGGDAKTGTTAAARCPLLRTGLILAATA